MTRRVLRVGALVLVGSAVLSGCTFEGAASLPLPGGVGTGGDAYELRVEFPDVLDLVPASAVKVDDVTVGTVKAIELRGFTAVVTIRVKDDVVLPENATASLRQTSLLGEKFVSLERPATGATGQLRDGAVIGLERTTRNTEIEELLSALSLVLNGGSLEQLQVINKELIAALQGREDKVKDVLAQLNAFVGGLDKQKGQIVRALDSLDRLTARFARERQTIATALEDLPGGARVLTEQRKNLTAVLQGLDRLGDVAVRVINATQQNTVADLKALAPILSGLNAAGKDLPDALELLTTYPFPRTIDKGIRGDYANLYVTLETDTAVLADNLGLPVPVPPLPLPGAKVPTAPKAPTAPVVPPVPPVPLVPDLVPDGPLPELKLPGGLRLRADGTSPTFLGLLLGGLS